MGHIEVKELTEGGNVNTIHINNKGEVPVLILDGEEIQGAKQNRMVNATIMLFPVQETEVPVSCVEQGRWRYDSPVFDKSENFGYNSLRRQKAEQVAYSLRTSGSYNADQGAIWEEIDRKHACMGTHSPTAALNEVYKNYEEKLEQLLEGLTPSPEQAGVAVFINNRFSCLDLFDRPQTLGRVWQKLIKSYAMEALEAGSQAKARRKPDLQKLLGALSEAECSTYPSVGMGNDLRLKGRGIIGAALEHEGRLLHLSVFATAQSKKPERNRESRMERPSRRRRNLE